MGYLETSRLKCHGEPHGCEAPKVEGLHVGDGQRGHRGEEKSALGHLQAERGGRGQKKRTWEIVRDWRRLLARAAAERVLRAGPKFPTSSLPHLTTQRRADAGTCWKMPLILTNQETARTCWKMPLILANQETGTDLLENASESNKPRNDKGPTGKCL